MRDSFGWILRVSNVWWSILHVNGSRRHEFTEIAPWLVQFFMDIVGQDSSPCVHKIAVKLSTLPCPAGRCKSGHWTKIRQLPTKTTSWALLQGTGWSDGVCEGQEGYRPTDPKVGAKVLCWSWNDIQIRMKDWNRWEKGDSWKESSERFWKETETLSDFCFFLWICI